MLLRCKFIVPLLAARWQAICITVLSELFYYNDGGRALISSKCVNSSYNKLLQGSGYLPMYMLLLANEDNINCLVIGNNC